MSVVGELPDLGGTNEFRTLTGKGSFSRMSPANLSPVGSKTDRIRASDLGGSVSSLCGRDGCGKAYVILFNIVFMYVKTVLMRNKDL